MADLPKIQIDNLFLGTMGWSYRFWDIYKGVTPSHYLHTYAMHFNSVEINSSFYRIPRMKTVEKWAKETPQTFIFTAKFPQSISHSPNLEYEPSKLKAFFKNMKPLSRKMGPYLIQFPPKFKADSLKPLDNLLNELPKNNKYAIEFRNRSWFKEEVFKILREHRAALVQVESPSQQPVNEITTDFIYIRWEGDRKSVNGNKGQVEIDKSSSNSKWAARITGYLNESLDVYGYFSKYYSGYPPADINHILTMINRKNQSLASEPHEISF